MWMKCLHISPCVVCAAACHKWIFMRWAQFTLSVSFSHLFNRHLHVYMLLYFQCSVQCNRTCQVSADNEPIYRYCIEFFAPHNVYKLQARETERKRKRKTVAKKWRNDNNQTLNQNTLHCAAFLYFLMMAKDDPRSRNINNRNNGKRAKNNMNSIGNA